MLVGGNRRWNRWQRPAMAISNYPIYWMSGSYLARTAVHLAEDGSEERALSTTDGSDNGGQATLLDGHVDIMDEGLGFLGVLISGRRSGGIVLLGPLERTIGDADGIDVDWVGVRGNGGSLTSHQEGVDAAPGSSSDGASTRRETEDSG